MKTMRKFAVGFSLVLIASICSAAPPPRKLLDSISYDHGWERDMASLDVLAKALGEEPGSTGYVIIYAARRARRGEVERRMQCMKSYLTERRGIPPKRIKFLRGGHREHSMIELWIVPLREFAPLPTPTVKPKDARILKGRIRYHCEI